MTKSLANEWESIIENQNEPYGGRYWNIRQERVREDMNKYLKQARLSLLSELEEGVKPLFRDEFNNYTRSPEDIEDDVLSLINNLKKE